MISEQGLATNRPIQVILANAGMDFDSRPVELGVDKWRYAFNVIRAPYLMSIPRKAVAYTLPVVGSVQWIGSLPIGTHSIWIVIAGGIIYQLRWDFSEEMFSNFAVYPLGSTGGPPNDRLSSFVYNNCIYFVGRQTPVFAIDGTRVRSLAEHRWSRLKPNDQDLTGDGPVTKYVVRVGDSIVGDLGQSATIQHGKHYRVYCENPRMFRPGWTVKVFWTDNPNVSFSGVVTGVFENFISIDARIGVTGFPNTKTRVPGHVIITDCRPPSGRYVTVFFDHLVVGHPTDSPNKIVWSHLRDFAVWDADTPNEADSYTFTEHQSSYNAVVGVTGLANMGDWLAVFTSNCVYRVDYVGLPTVVRVTTLSQETGCGFYYGFTSVDGMVFWCDPLKQDFKQMNAVGEIQSIGHGINTFFFDDVNKNPETIQNLWCFADRPRNEVCWVYPSFQSDGELDRMVVYNYKHNEWCVRQSERLTAFSFLALCSTPVVGLQETVSELTGPVSKLGLLNTSVGRMYGDEFHALLVEHSPGADAVLRPYEAAVLETGDLVFGSLQTVKEIDGIALSSNGSVGVEVSTRSNLDAGVYYTSAGVWTPSLTTGNFLPFNSGGFAGNIFRLRFRITEPRTTLSILEPNGFSVGAQY